MNFSTKKNRIRISANVKVFKKKSRTKVYETINTEIIITNSHSRKTEKTLVASVFFNDFQFPLIFQSQNFNEGFGVFSALFARAARKIYTILILKGNFLIENLISEMIFHHVIFRSPRISLNLISISLKLREISL